MVWGRDKQALTTRLCCTSRAIRAWLYSGKSTSEGGQACRSAICLAGWAMESQSRYREFVETCWILSEHGATRVWHWLPLCWHYGACYIGCDPAGSVAWQEGHNLYVCSSDIPTGNRHATQEHGCHYSPGNLQPILQNWFEMPEVNICTENVVIAALHAEIVRGVV